MSFSGDDDYRTEDFFKYICKYNGKNLIIGHGKYISNEGKPIRTISTNIINFILSKKFTPFLNLKYFTTSFINEIPLSVDPT